MVSQAITSKDINALSGRTYPASGRGVSPLALLRQLGRWYGQNRRYRQTVSALAKLSDDVLADIGIRRHEIHEVAQRTSRDGL